MNAETRIFNYQELVDVIKKYNERSTSGTLLIFTDANMFVRITLDKGNIILMTCGDKQGMDVIPILKKLQSCQLKFSPNQRLRGNRVPLPVTQDIIAQLMLKNNIAPSAEELSVEAIQSEQMDNVLGIVEAELIEFLGPMGSIVWEEYVDKVKYPISPDDLKSLVSQVAQEIGDIEKMVEFKKQVNNKINKV